MRQYLLQVAKMLAKFCRLVDPQACPATVSAGILELNRRTLICSTSRMRERCPDQNQVVRTAKRDMMESYMGPLPDRCPSSFPIPSTLPLSAQECEMVRQPLRHTYSPRSAANLRPPVEEAFDFAARATVGECTEFEMFVNLAILGRRARGWNLTLLTGSAKTIPMCISCRMVKIILCQRTGAVITDLNLSPNL